MLGRIRALTYLCFSIILIKMYLNLITDEMRQPKWLWAVNQSLSGESELAEKDMLGGRNHSATVSILRKGTGRRIARG